MTSINKSENLTVARYEAGMKIFRSPNFGVDHPFRATRQIFGPSVLDTESATHVERKRSWIAQFLPAALLHKASDVRGPPFPRRIHPTVSVTGMPSAV